MVFVSLKPRKMKAWIVWILSKLWLVAAKYISTEAKASTAVSVENKLGKKLRPETKIVMLTLRQINIEA